MGGKYGRVRQADINIDGYPDLFLTAEFKSLSNPKINIAKSFVALSKECDFKKCSKEATSHKAYGLNSPRRYFVVSGYDEFINTDDITKLANGDSVLIVPMDIDGIGNMDILL